MTDLIIRADGGATIGAGHLMRCLALAAEWRRRGGRVTLLSDAPAALLAPYVGLKATIIPCPDAAPELLRTCLRDMPPAWVVLDGYHFTVEHQRAVRAAGHWLLLLDDMGILPAYEAHLLLNQNVDAHVLRRKYPADADCLLGTRYVLLREDFAGQPPPERHFSGIARRLLLTMGGADPQDLTSRFLKLFNRISAETLEIAVLAGGANRHLESIEQAAGASRHKVAIWRNSDTVREHMEAAELAVSAVGITCYEMAYLGLPSVIVPYARNQYGAAEYLHRHGIMKSLGPSAELDETKASEEIAALLEQPAQREALSIAGVQLVDGRGAARVTEEMIARHGNL